MLPLFWRFAPSRLKIHWSLTPRPHYAYCLFQAATLAQRLGIDRISALEFGVAGGNGLALLEMHARWIERQLGVKIETFGFDGGEGLPEPQDYRDLPYHWKAGFFRMDRKALARRLKNSKLVFGNVCETVTTFFENYDAPPIGCILHDLDFYSSTRDALRLLDGPSERFLPRIFNYFDDIVGTDIELYNDFTGQRRAIAEFNEAHDLKKMARCYHFGRLRRRRMWHDQIFIMHDFKHPLYNKFISGDNQQLPLTY
jgi:hypothetical protein